MTQTVQSPLTQVRRGNGAPLVSAADLPPHGHFIANEFVADAGGELLDIVNPADESVIAQVLVGTAADVRLRRGPPVGDRARATGRHRGRHSVELPIAHGCLEDRSDSGRGNVLVLKPSEQTPLTTLKFAEFVADLLPAGVFNVVTGFGQVVGDRLSAHPQLDMIALTGSVNSGRACRRTSCATANPLCRAVARRRRQGRSRAAARRLVEFCARVVVAPTLTTEVQKSSLSLRA